MKMSEVCDFLDDPSQFELVYKGSKVEYLNEAGTVSDSSRFFAAGFEFGAHVIVHVESYRGDGFETAWEAWIDSQDTIPEDELPEAYQLDGETFDDMARDEMKEDAPPYFSPEWHAHIAKQKERAKVLMTRAFEDAETTGKYPDLVEGYEMQSNCSGTGVVYLGHYAWMHEADLDDLELVRKSDTAE